MKIAVLGWGSLIPHPEKCGRKLLIRGGWHKDGPLLPIEYARISKTGELTLVLHPGVRRVRTLWVYSAFHDLYSAIRNLRIRERIKRKYTYRIGYASIYDGRFNSHAVHYVAYLVKKWAIKKEFDAVIWTDLPENFKKKRNRPFSENEAINYIRSLTGSVREIAKQYVQETPKQVKTHLRPRLEKELGL